MGLFGSQEDQAKHSVRRTKVFLDAVDHVALRTGDSFADMDLETKQRFLTTHMLAITEQAIAQGGPEFENLRNFRAFIVENKGSAVLYFERRIK
jgi:hypothetical protein